MDIACKEKYLLQLLSGGPSLLLEFKQAAPELLHFALFYIDPDAGKMKPTEVHDKNINKKPARPGTKETVVNFFSSYE